MKTEDLFKPAVDWSGGTLAGRIDDCASMLFCHGYIPLSVREKIAKKLTKECEAALASGIEARSDETPQAAQPVGQEPDPKGDAQ